MENCSTHAKQSGCRVRQQGELGVRVWYLRHTEAPVRK